ncbi:DUF4192 domain-containing protein [Pseudonocardia ailaonensis]|uniref:DUF4192 domain-containing protein n=1 Tax=Pseudonocardia ailaonensis TaxID=367279 RepID=A0ABN2N3E8_9PSEU
MSSLPFLPPVPASDPALRVGTEGLLAAVPVLLGFRPRDSLVLVATGGPGGRRVGLVLRADLPPPGEIGEFCDMAARSLCRQELSGAAVIVVGGGTAAGGVPPRGDVAAAAGAALRERGVGVHTVAWVAATEEGANWCCYPAAGCGCSGLLPDPSSTVLAATAVSRGAVVYGSREELERQVLPAAGSGRVWSRSAGSDGTGSVQAGSARAGSAPRGSARAGSAHAGSVRGGARRTGSAGREARRRMLQEALDDAEAGRLLVGPELAEGMASAFDEPSFREIALNTCAGPRAAAAEQLWAALARACPGRAAADPAAYLAVCAILRGDGALATIALTRAHEVWPGHLLASSLIVAIDAGWGPAEVRAWIEEA